VGGAAELAAELVRLNVDLLVTEGTPASQAAKQATRLLPVIMVYVGDPVASGLVSSLARPGGNVTGVSMIAAPTRGPVPRSGEAGASGAGTGSSSLNLSSSLRCRGVNLLIRLLVWPVVMARF